MRPTDHSNHSFRASNNPFRVSRVRPGALPFLFSASDNSKDLEQLNRLTTQWIDCGGLGQIIGPHGVGKNTLAISMVRHAVETGQIDANTIRSIIFRKHSDDLANDSAFLPNWTKQFRRHGLGCTTELLPAKSSGSKLTSTSSTTRNLEEALIIDGLERLPIFVRTLLLRSLKKSKSPTLITSHQKLKTLPFLSRRLLLLIELSPDVKVFARLIEILTEGANKLTDSKIEFFFTSSNGNYRDAFMALYDHFASSKAK